MHFKSVKKNKQQTQTQVNRFKPELVILEDRTLPGEIIGLTSLSLLGQSHLLTYDQYFEPLGHSFLGAASWAKNHSCSLMNLKELRPTLNHQLFNFILQSHNLQENSSSSNIADTAHLPTNGPSNSLISTTWNELNSNQLDAIALHLAGKEAGNSYGSFTTARSSPGAYYEGYPYDFFFMTVGMPSYSSVTVTINWGDGTQDFYGVERSNGEGTYNYEISRTHAYGDNGDYTVTMAARLDVSQTLTRPYSFVNYSSTQQALVLNKDPENVTFGQTSSYYPYVQDFPDNILEGSTVHFSIGATDRGFNLDTLTATINWGNGETDTYTMENVLGSNPNATMTGAQRSYYYNGSKDFSDDDPTGSPEDLCSATLTITDDDGGSAVHSFAYTLQNQLPGADPYIAEGFDENGEPYWSYFGEADMGRGGVSEGQSAVIQAYVVDPSPNDSVDVTIDWGDGTIETQSVVPGPAGLSVDFSHYFPDDDPTDTPSDSYPITLTVTDDDGGMQEYHTWLDVFNTSPEAELIIQGDAWANSIANAEIINTSDQGANDTFEYRFDSNFDGDYNDSGEGWGTSDIFEYTIPNLSYVTFNAQVRDDDNGVRSLSKQTTVRTNGPKISITSAEGLYNSTDTYIPGYTSRDGKGRIFANAAFNVSDSNNPTWSKNTQYVDFTVTATDYQGAVKVHWFFEDPDDKSNEMTDVSPFSKKLFDPNDYSNNIRYVQTGNDNLGTLDGKSQWQQLENYAITEAGQNLTGAFTPIINGVSKVRFNVTDRGGDNFRVKVILTTANGDDLSTAATGVFIVWKRINLEYTKMPSGNSLDFNDLAYTYDPTYVTWKPSDVRNVPDIPILTPATTENAYVKSTNEGGVFDHAGQGGWFLLASAGQYEASSSTESTKYIDHKTIGSSTILETGSQVTGLGGLIQLPRSLAINETPSDIWIYKPGDNTKSLWLAFDSFATSNGVVDRSKIWVRSIRYHKPDNVNVNDYYDLGACGYHLGASILVDVDSPGSTVLSGISPVIVQPNSQKLHFQGTTIVFNYPGVTANEIKSTMAHELAHAMGITHDGFQSFRVSDTGKHAIMTYSIQWERQHATGQGLPALIPWSASSAVSTSFSAEDIVAIRNAHLEEDVDGRHLGWS